MHNTGGLARDSAPAGSPLGCWQVLDQRADFAWHDARSIQTGAARVAVASDLVSCSDAREPLARAKVPLAGGNVVPSWRRLMDGSAFSANAVKLRALRWAGRQSQRTPFAVASSSAPVRLSGLRLLPAK